MSGDTGALFIAAPARADGREKEFYLQRKPPILILTHIYAHGTNEDLKWNESGDHDVFRILNLVFLRPPDLALRSLVRILRGRDDSIQEKDN